MAIRTLTSALAAGALMLAASAQAAAPVAAPARTSAPVGEVEQLGGSGFLPVGIFIVALLVALFVASDSDGDDLPHSP